jgi:hypothetical protein
VSFILSVQTSPILLSVIILCVVMLSVVMLNVIMLRVVAPFEVLFTHERQIDTISIETFLSLQIATAGDSNKHEVINGLC